MKQDSLYTAGCESYFYSCNAHKAYRLYCPQGLYFDANEKKCDIRENVDECKSQELVINHYKQYAFQICEQSKITSFLPDAY